LTHRRSDRGSKYRASQERQLVSELQSIHNTGLRGRTRSDANEFAPFKRTANNQVQYESRVNHYVTGAERPGSAMRASDQPAKYTFNTSPSYSTLALNRLNDSSAQEETLSMHRVKAASSQQLSQQHHHHQQQQQQQLFQQQQQQSPVVETIEQETISLQPIGRGVQNLEPDAEHDIDCRTIIRSPTPNFTQRGRPCLIL